MAPRHYYFIALAGFIGLFALLMLNHTVFNISPNLPIAATLLLTVTPLLVPMRGFLRGQPKSSAWLAYLSLIYFIHGCMSAYANEDEDLFGLLEILFSLMIFSGITFYLRLLKRH